MKVARNIEWLNANALRAFPFREDAQLTPQAADGIRVPNSAVVDFVLSVADTGLGRVYMHSVVKTGAFITFTFADQAGAQVALIAVNSATHTRNQGYSFSGVGAYEDARGRMVLGDLGEFMSDIPDGQWVFTLETAELETTTVRPMLRGVRSISVENDGAESARMYGHIKLVSGSNIRLTPDDTTNSIRIDALSTTGFQEECACENVEVIIPVETVNGIGVQNLVIAGDGKCVTVTPSGNRLVIADTCSTPCCGCPEQDFLVKHLELLEATLARVETAISEVVTRQQEYESRVGVTTR